MVNGELIEPITQAPSVSEQSVIYVIIIGDDSSTDNIVVLQEWDSDIKQEPVDSDVVDTTMAEDDSVPEKPLGTVQNTSGQRRSEGVSSQVTQNEGGTTTENCPWQFVRSYAR